MSNKEILLGIMSKKPKLLKEETIEKLQKEISMDNIETYGIKDVYINPGSMEFNNSYNKINCIHIDDLELGILSKTILSDNYGDEVLIITISNELFKKYFLK